MPPKKKKSRRSSKKRSRRRRSGRRGTTRYGMLEHFRDMAKKDPSPIPASIPASDPSEIKSRLASIWHSVDEILKNHRDGSRLMEKACDIYVFGDKGTQTEKNSVEELKYWFGTNPGKATNVNDFQEKILNFSNYSPDHPSHPIGRINRMEDGLKILKNNNIFELAKREIAKPEKPDLARQLFEAQRGNPKFNWAMLD